ncbi:MAG: serine hydrolase, partial [Ectothiorhodospiraceae bacterium]|nr:serine hydrolase [Ectothiorhodospiraceae bacterium]
PLDEWLEIVEREHTVSKNAYSRMRIGSQLTRGELLRLALMSSENLATHVLAHHHPGGREAFIDAMNAKAAELGMHNTRFADSSGLSLQNTSTASDLLKMVRAAHDYGEIRLFSTTPYQSAQFRGPRYALGDGNTNSLVSNPGWNVLLSKTGYLKEAGRCLVMVTEVEGRPVAMVFLNSRGTRTPLGDAGRLRRWLVTGEGGSVAQSAMEYERQQAARLEVGG